MYQAVAKLFPFELMLEDAPHSRRDSSSSVTMQDVFLGFTHTTAEACSLQIELWMELKM